MGGFYLSLQARTTKSNVAETLEQLCTKYSSDNLQLYCAKPLNGWLGIYPVIDDDITEKFACDLSGSLNTLVLLLASFDEDDFYCQFYRNGKPTGEFKVGVEVERDKKSREQIKKALENLHDICDNDTIAALEFDLCDAEEPVFMSHLLVKFSQSVGISNTLISFDYIQKQDLEGLDVQTTFTPFPKGEWKSRAIPSTSAPHKKSFDINSPAIQTLVNFTIANKNWKNDPQIFAQLKVLESFGITQSVIEEAMEKYKQNPDPLRDKKIAAITHAMKIAEEAKEYRGTLPEAVEVKPDQILTEKSSTKEIVQALQSINQAEWQPTVEELAALRTWMKQSLQRN